MAQMNALNCDACGQLVDLAQTELCPVCQYPVQPDKEQRFLETSLHDLQRVVRYGGVSLRVTDLIYRYEGRLQFLRTMAQDLQAASASRQDLQAAEELAEASEPVVAEAEALPELPVLLQPVREAEASAPGVFARGGQIAVAPAASMRGFALSGDAMVNVLAAVGGFLVLAGVLGTVFVTPSLWLSFLVVLGVHAAFGGASLLTRRSTLLRAVSPLYTIIFALLVPLLAFSAYRLVENNLVAMSPATLLAFSALYATIIYATLAVVQRFVPFAYLSCVALLVGDLALAQALNLSYWWWPVLAMALPLGALLALPRSSGPDLFTERRAILRQPLMVLMALVIAGVTLSGPVMFLGSLLLSSFDSGQPFDLQPRLAVFVLCCLFVFWYLCWLWYTRWKQGTPLLAGLCLVLFFLLGYTLNLNLDGYILLETAIALFYHTIVRAVRGQLDAYGFPARTLDGLVLGLVLLVLAQTGVFVLLQLLTHTFNADQFAQQNGGVYFLLRPFMVEAQTTLNVWALVMCLLLTLDMSLMHAGFSRKPARADWCWLLVLSGVLLSAIYGLEVLAWQLDPLWAYAALSLALLTCAVLVRHLSSPAWAYPLECLVLLEVAFTLLLSLSQSWSTISGLLLAFAALIYSVALVQHRPYQSLLPAVLFLLALFSLSEHPLLVLVLSLLLPLLAAGLRRARLFEGRRGEARELFAWTLLLPALISGLVLSDSDMLRSQSACANWISGSGFALFGFVSWWGAQVTVAYEIAGLGLAWYAAALLGREKLWLLPATLFGVLALLQPGINFWALSLLAPALAIVAVGLEKWGARAWAWPFYLLALCSAGMLVSSAFVNGQLEAASWFLLGYALLAYGIGLVTEHLSAPILTPVCATLGVYIAASQVGDLYTPLVVALLGAGVGFVAGRLAHARGRPAWRYALPFYASGLAAAVLTGLAGSLGDLSRPFYGALPAALFVYALVAGALAWSERRASWNWLVAVFACWGVLVTWRLTAWYVLAAAVALALLALLSEWLTRRVLQAEPAATQAFRLAGRASWLWPWPWYSAALLGTLLLGSWPLTTNQALAGTPVVQGMFVLTLLALVSMLVRRAPELLVFPVVLAFWSIGLWWTLAAPTQLLVSATVLCILIYAGQFIWRLWPANLYRLPASLLHHLFSLGGLCLVLLLALDSGALSSEAGPLAQAGVLALVTLSGLLALYGQLRPANALRASTVFSSSSQRATLLARAQEQRHACFYGAGALLSLAISWELLAWGQTRLDTLTLVPASYLIVSAPFLLRDQALSARQIVGQRVALLGSALLLLPALWFSFQGADLTPTLLLLGEALLLLLLGLLLRMRIFILSSAALIIVGTMRLLFISMPPSVPILLLVFGALLMALATVLILSRHRLQTAWSQWE
ncbi:MAG TPA: hypothetical protein VGD98_18475 [Ktedonobacteraceae bacterium]